jgi:hypothetical protein
MTITEKREQVEQQLTEAAEVYKSGQTNSKAALAKVKRLVRQKLSMTGLA